MQYSKDFQPLPSFLSDYTEADFQADLDDLIESGLIVRVLMDGEVGYRKVQTLADMKPMGRA